ncbi:hypothetical protein EDB19DRAFT_1591612, partial [Suillus lakei]
LYTIIISESAHLIWKLQCERVIKFNGDESQFHLDTEIHNRWVKALNTRLKFHKLLSNASRYSKKALKVDTVLCTWSGVLMNEDNLPNN